jgi:ABC-type uncharacterized transport system auxiliary subunit
VSDQSARRDRAAAQAIDARRRALALALPLGAIALAGGCVSIGGGDTPAPVWYLLEDRGASAAQSRGPSGAAGTAASAGTTGTTGRGTAAPIDRVLLIGPVLASSFDEGSMLAYSRQPGTRAHYQFAGWTERPAPRIGVLVERRLAARGSFAAVAQGTAGIRGDIVLNLALEHLYHDVSTTPGLARVAIAAELVDWRDRALVARRTFERTAPVARESADAAVDAINRALADLLDELVAWVESAPRRVAAGA